MIGQNILHYRIESKLGEGGMGEVFLAYDTKLDRHVALKFLPDRMNRAPEARHRFLREAKAISRSNHPNVVTIYAIETVEDRDFLVMEHVKGVTLDEFIRKPDRPIQRVIDIGVQLCRGLQHAHNAGVVHRDLKPTNIMLDPEGRIRILDFGLARLRDESSITRDGSLIGTPSYMSPEHVLGETLDERSDLWSLGAIIYEMLVGARAYPGTTTAGVVYAILNDKPRPINSARHDCPIAFQLVVLQCMQKKREDRIGSAAELVLALENINADPGGFGKFTGLRYRLSPKQLVAMVVVLVASITLGVRLASNHGSLTEETNLFAEAVAATQSEDPHQPPRIAVRRGIALFGDESAKSYALSLTAALRTEMESRSGFEVIAGKPESGEEAADGDSESDRASGGFSLSTIVIQQSGAILCSAVVSSSVPGTPIWKAEFIHTSSDPAYTLGTRIVDSLMTSIGWGNYSEREWRQTTGATPGSVMKWIERGNYYLSEGHPSLAVEMFDSAAAIDPNNVSARYYRGRALELSADFSGAMRQYNLALADAPSQLATVWDTLLTRPLHTSSELDLRSHGSRFALAYDNETRRFHYTVLRLTDHVYSSGFSTLAEGLPIPCEVLTGEQSWTNFLWSDRWNSGFWDDTIRVPIRFLSKSGRTTGATSWITIASSNQLRFLDGLLGVYGSDSIRVFDTTGRAIVTEAIPNHRSSEAPLVRLSSDRRSQRLAVVSGEECHVYSMAGGRPIQTIRFTGRVLDLSASDDALLVQDEATSSLEEYSLSTGKSEWKFELPPGTDDLREALVVAGQTYLLLGRRSATLIKRSKQFWQPRLAFHRDYQGALSFDLQGDSLWIITSQGECEVYQLPEGILLSRGSGFIRQTSDFAPNCRAGNGLFVLTSEQIEGRSREVLSLIGGESLSLLWQIPLSTDHYWRDDLLYNEVLDRVYVSENGTISEIAGRTGRVLTRRRLVGDGMPWADLVADSLGHVFHLSYWDDGVKIAELAPGFRLIEIAAADIRLRLFRLHEMAGDERSALKSLMDAQESDLRFTTFIRLLMHQENSLTNTRDSLLYALTTDYQALSSLDGMRDYICKMLEESLGIRILADDLHPGSPWEDYGPALPGAWRNSTQAVWPADSGIFHWTATGAEFVGDHSCQWSAPRSYKPLKVRGTGTSCGWIEFAGIEDDQPEGVFASARPIALSVFDSKNCGQASQVDLRVISLEGNTAVDGYLVDSSYAVVVAVPRLPNSPDSLKGETQMAKGRDLAIFCFDAKSGSRLGRFERKGDFQFRLAWRSGTRTSAVIGFGDIAFTDVGNNTMLLIFNDSLLVLRLPSLKQIASSPLHQRVKGLRLAGNLGLMTTDSSITYAFDPNNPSSLWEIGQPAGTRLEGVGEEIFSMSVKEGRIDEYSPPRGVSGKMRRIKSMSNLGDLEFAQLHGSRLLWSNSPWDMRASTLSLLDLSGSNPVRTIKFPFPVAWTVASKGSLYGLTRSGLLYSLSLD